MSQSQFRLAISVGLLLLICIIGAYLLIYVPIKDHNESMIETDEDTYNYESNTITTIINYLEYESSYENFFSLVGTQTEYDNIVDTLNTLIVLEESEKINIAKITDINQLLNEDATFYAKARNGDYLIVLPDSQRVLIYDDTNKEVINFSSYSIKVDLIPDNQIPDSEKPLTIELRSVTSITDDTIAQVEEALIGASTNYSIEGKTKAANDNYEGITLVLLSRSSKPMLSQNIVAHTGTNNILEKLPYGEETSSADIVIILGKQ